MKNAKFAVEVNDCIWLGMDTTLTTNYFTIKKRKKGIYLIYVLFVQQKRTIKNSGTYCAQLKILFLFD